MSLAQVQGTRYHRSVHILKTVALATIDDLVLAIHLTDVISDEDFEESLKFYHG